MRSRLIFTILMFGAACGLAEQPSPPGAKPLAPSNAFSTDVQPVVAKYCAACHNDKKQSGELNLTVLTASVTKDRDTWTTIKQRLELKEMPPKKQPQPTDEERRKFVAWIGRELSQSTVAATPGRVTLRRLNRDEYNRTVRDLCGVNFRPADDFPTDDVGHGFDNIGDVLSMPPILLEKYLNASEQVVRHIFEADPKPPVIVKINAKELQSTSKKAEMVTNRGQPALQVDDAAAIFANYTSPRDGELIYRVRLVSKHNESDKTDRVKLSFRVDDKEIRNQTANFQPNNPVSLEVRTKIKAGPHKLAVAFTNPADDKVEKKDRRAIRVAYIEVQEPLEPPQRPAGYAKVMIGDPKDSSRDRARQILAKFASRAYRRQVRDDEVNRLVKLFDMAKLQGDSFDQSVTVALQAVLVSPNFLFRVEKDRTPDRPDGSYALNDWEIASRLSYFLWSSMPDEELSRLAEQGKLIDSTIRAAQVKRMLKDPKAFALVENFGGQWLNLRNLQTAQPARRDYPAWDESLRTAIRRETELFFNCVMTEDRSIMDFLDSDYTFLNERLARHYKITGVTGDEFRKVKLTDRNRGGVLTQASVLTITSNPTRTSPVKRGKWILENILGTPPPPPPPDVPELKEDKEVALKGSLRQRMEQHRANPNCATCHERMDPLGFGLENFDGVGGWRTTDGSFKIDSSGVLPDGSTFAGPAELKKILLAKDEAFRHCLTEKMLTYALGRGVEPSDNATVDRIADAVKFDQNRFGRLVLEIVNSDAFLRRTVKR